MELDCPSIFGLYENHVKSINQPAHTIRLGLFLISAATLIFEINLTRLFSVTQFYHFAFMIVSIALLGFGASGTALTIYPKLAERSALRNLAFLCIAAGTSIILAYLLINRLPFDSFSIAWDRRQVFILIFHYVALAAPFFFSGLAVGSLLQAYPQAVNTTYATNLFGSAIGCLAALALPGWLGGEGTVIVSAGLASASALICFIQLGRSEERLPIPGILLSACLLLLALVDTSLRASHRPAFAWLELAISPYKSLSYALQYPNTEVIYQRWNAFSRIDVIHSRGVHSFPGLSYRYLQPLPPQDGLFVDGDELSPILLSSEDADFAGSLSAALAYQLRPRASVLILEPRGGLDIITAQEQGAAHITVVEINPLIVEAASEVYHQPGVQVIVESDRSFLHRTNGQYDIIVHSLATSYHPVRSGAYSLAEDYRYTIEAFQDAYAHLAPGGILLVTRWLQTPPSESLRTFGLAVTALERIGADPHQQIVAFRGYNTITFLIKETPFTTIELQSLRDFASEMAFDLVITPDLQPDEVNRFNILPEPTYYLTFNSLIATQPRRDFYRSYPYDVRPPSDDHPFFGHYFKWGQARQLLAEVGKTWQPFGGAGYFVLLALLGLAIVLAAILIVLPVLLAQIRTHSAGINLRSAAAPLFYFGTIGLAFLLVEIPLIQRFILFLGNPSYAITTVLFCLLFFSGLGSVASNHLDIRLTLAGLILVLWVTIRLLPTVFEHTLGFPLPLRLGVAVLILTPLGFLMGMPFPAGIRQITDQTRTGGKKGIPLIPWIWAVNGAASVIAAVAAALLALSLGYSWVLWIGALCYTIAWITLMVAAPRGLAAHPRL